MGQLKLGSSFVGQASGSTLLLRTAVPTVWPSGGTVATDGVVTFTTAMPNMRGPAWIRFPAGAIIGGTATLYAVNMLTDTTGQVYTLTKAATDKHQAFNPSELTPAVGSNSVYIGPTGAQLSLAISVPGGLMGPNSVLCVDALFNCTSSANAKFVIMNYGVLSLYTDTAPTTTTVIRTMPKVFNRGSQNSQLILSGAYNGAPTGASQTSTPLLGDMNTKEDSLLYVQFGKIAANDYIALQYLEVKVEE